MTKHGGGICVSDGDAIIINNLFTNNSAWYGGGISCLNSSDPLIIGNTITGNNAEAYGGGIYTDRLSYPTVTNTIIWRNTAILSKWSDLYGLADITYSNVKGAASGTGNIYADPLFVSGSKGFHYLSQKTAGQSVDSPCIDIGGDLVSKLGMDIYWTRTDETPDTGIVDIGFHYGDFTFPSLLGDTSNISASTGGAANFLLMGGTENANRKFLMLGSVSGANPKTPLPGGKAALPIAWDAFTILMMTYMNTPLFNNFMGKLDGVGEGSSAFDVLGPVNPMAIGVTIHFAYALNNPWNFASNYVWIEIAP